MPDNVPNTKYPVVIHDKFFAKNRLSDLLKNSLQNKFTVPDTLKIILISTSKSKTVAEQSLDFLGLTDYAVIKKEIPANEWRGVLKIKWIEEYLLHHEKSNRKHILYFDSYDAIIRNDPRIAMELLQENRCKMLLSTTKFAGGYESMPETLQWAKSIAPNPTVPSIFLNAGVFIAEREFLLSVFQKVHKYITGNELRREEYRTLLLKRNDSFWKNLKEFPKGIGSDQVILRYLHPKLHPEMKIDYTERLACR